MYKEDISFSNQECSTQRKRIHNNNLREPSVSKTQLVETLEHIRKLKNKTTVKLHQYQNILKEKEDSIQELKQYIKRQQQKTKETVTNYEKQLKINQQRELKLLEEQRKLETEINELFEKNVKMEEENLSLRGSNELLNNEIILLRQSKYELQRINQQNTNKYQQICQYLKINTQQDIVGLKFLENYGGITSFIQKYKQDEINMIDIKYKLENKIHSLKFELEKCHDEKCYTQNVFQIKLKEFSQRQQQLQKLTLQNTNLSAINKSLLESLQETKKNLDQKNNKIGELEKQKLMLQKSSEYNELIEGLFQQESDYFKINQTINELSKYKGEYYSNVQKIQYLCELLQNN